MEMRRGWLEEFSRGQGGVESRGVEGGGGPKCCERLRASALNPQKISWHVRARITSFVDVRASSGWTSYITYELARSILYYA